MAHIEGMEVPVPSPFPAPDTFAIWLSLSCVLYKTLVMAQRVKRLPTTWETRVQSLRWEDLLEKEMATHSSILAWKIPWMEEAVRLQSMRSLMKL